MLGDTHNHNHMLILSRSLFWNGSNGFWCWLLWVWRRHFVVAFFYSCVFLRPRINLIGFVYVTAMISNIYNSTNRPFDFGHYHYSLRFNGAMEMVFWPWQWHYYWALCAGSNSERKSSSQNKIVSLDCVRSQCSQCELNATLRHFMIKLKLSFALHSLLNRF